MPNRLELPKDPKLAAKVLETQHAQSIAEMGKIGTYFGSKDNAVVYLASVVIMIALIGGTVLACVEPALRPDWLKVCAALALAALSYIFGKAHLSS